MAQVEAPFSNNIINFSSRAERRKKWNDTLATVQELSIEQVLAIFVQHEPHDNQTGQVKLHLVGQPDNLSSRRRSTRNPVVGDLQPPKGA